MIDTLKAWHHIVEARDPSGLAALLHDDVVFHSPVVHAPQRGKALTSTYLHGALQVLNNGTFRYVREIIGARDALLEFVSEVDGIHVNGVDLIQWDDAGQIIDFKVMLRPLKGMEVVRAKMAELLARAH